VRAVFENKDRLLMPGMFVRADVVIEGLNQAILVPQQGVSINPNGLTNTMIVGAENKIESREIKVLKAVDDKWLVSEGLQEGDQVVIKGLQKIKVGAVVNPTDPVAAKVPEAK